MTIEEFIKELHHYGEGFFDLSPSGTIRSYDRILCPIEFLANKVGAYLTAGPFLKLSGKDIGDIVRAVDKLELPGVFFYDYELRNRILEAVGLPLDAPKLNQETLK